MMICEEFNKIKIRVEYLYEKTKVCNDDSVNIFLENLCIKSSGLLEKGIYHLFMEYCKEVGSSDTLMAFFDEYFTKKVNAPSCENIMKTLNLFSADWKEQFKKNISKQDKDSLDSLINFRNKIAHGEDVDLRKADILKYFKNVEFILNQIGKIMNETNSNNN